MFRKLLSFLGRPDLDAATQLKPVATPKTRAGSKAYPSYFASTKPDSSKTLSRTDRQLSSKDITTYRSNTDSRKVIHDFVYSSPDLSAAVWAYLRVGIPSKYTAIACSATDNTIDVAATGVLQQIIARMDTMTPYDEGFSNVQSLKSLSESLGKELLMYGALAGELVLDKSRMPLKIQPVSVPTISFKPDGKGLKPMQTVGQDEIDLDVPTFIMIALDQDLLDPYSSSPLESAIKPVVFKEDFAQDIHRIIKRVGHPRQKVKIDEKMFRSNLSSDIINDSDKASAAMDALVSQVESKLAGLSPEDALVHLDSLSFEVETPANGGLAAEYDVLQQIGNSRLSTGAKTMGTVLGFQGGSSNIASAETMLFMKAATGAVKDKLDEFYSRIFTLALRLMGLDVVVKFTYADIDLRPEADLAAFRQTQQMMTLEKLSLGLITDEEASLTLTGKLPPPGYKPRAGTMFYRADASAATPTEPSNSGSTMNQNLNGDTPSTGRGQNKRAETLTVVGGA